MKHGSLFSGIGGFDLAAEWMEWENVFHCEWNEFGQKVLKHYWPNAISYHDITKTDFTIHRGTIDILTGGFPCQPYSTAGKRLGKEDERHLWPEMLRAIREIQPRWVIGENVSGLINWNGGMVFHEVQADLEAEGYEVQPYVLPACAVNAPHRRDRVWFVAFKNTDKDGRRSEQRESKSGEWQQRDIGTRDNEWIRANDDEIRAAPDTDFGRCKKCWPKWFTSKQFTQDYGLTSKPGICSRNDGISTKLDGITFSKWRNESIKAAGNAIVPQVVLQIFKAIQQFENVTK